MDEAIKMRVIYILAILTAIFFVSSVSSCSATHRLKSGRDKEMLTRLDLEEKFSKITQEKTRIEDKLAGLTKGLEEEKTAHQATNKALLQEQMVSQSLKEEVDKINRLKDALEENLKEALAGSPAKSKR